VFAAAATGDAILFFDEADALFGRRTDVGDAHDRYANLETSFLLQRLEVHRGIVILASNLERNLDPAFLRRIAVVARFALPGPGERREIWRRHLEPSHLADDVDLDLLSARIELTRGSVALSLIE
jgi:SpoVK/Ycf46/Vps4 family AAA+-type ATPase